MSLQENDLLKSEILISLLCPTFYKNWIPFFVHQLRKMTKGLQLPFEIIIATHIDKKLYMKELLKNNLDKKTKFIRTDKDTPIGTKRNLLDQEAKGLFLFSVDDDDWYPAYRISYSVSQLLKNPDQNLLTSSYFLCYNILERSYFRYMSYSESCLCRRRSENQRKFLDQNDKEGQGLINESELFLNTKSTVLCLAFTHKLGKRSIRSKKSVKTNVTNFIEEHFDHFEKMFIKKMERSCLISVSNKKSN